MAPGQGRQGPSLRNQIQNEDGWENRAQDRQLGSHSPSPPQAVTVWPLTPSRHQRPDGGGGSRTRVREWILQSIYVRSSLVDFTLGRPVSNRRRASCLNALAPRATASREGQPDSSTSQDPLRARRPGDGRVVSYAASARSELAIMIVPALFTRLPGPRHATPISPDTSKPCRPQFDCTKRIHDTRGKGSGSTPHRGGHLRLVQIPVQEGLHLLEGLHMKEYLPELPSIR